MRNRRAPITAGLLSAIGLTLIPVYLNAGSPAIPWSQLGAKMGAIHCVFQRLDGEATPEGLWLTSTGRAQTQRLVSEFLGAAETGELEPLLNQKVAVVRLVSCPVLLHQLQILMALSLGGEAGSDPHSN